MKIIKIHYKVSKPVSSFKEIAGQVKELVHFVDNGKYEGFYNKAYAIAHTQVSETPYAFFVVANECVTNNPKMKWYKMFADRVIINPKIVEASEFREIDSNSEELKKLGFDPAKLKVAKLKIPNTVEYNEMCMSFPFRTPKRIQRYSQITVQYQIKGIFGLKTIKATLLGIAAEIFQHECDHMQGKNIYFETETPVKWWELLGSKRPVGGVSLDQFDPAGMTPAREIPSNE